MYCDDLESFISDKKYVIENYKLAPMRTYSEKYKKTDNFKPGVVVKKMEGSYEIVATYPTVMTDMMEAAMDEIVRVLTTVEGSPENNQAITTLEAMCDQNGGTKYLYAVFQASGISTYRTEIEELSNMTTIEIVENYYEYADVLGAIRYTINPLNR